MPDGKWGQQTNSERAAVRTARMRDQHTNRHPKIGATAMQAAAHRPPGYSFSS
jgi:hypothetical protein